MKTLKALVILAVIFCLVGPLLLLCETAIVGAAAKTQVIPITLLAIFFFAYSYVSMQIQKRLLEQESKILPTFYLAVKMIRLLLCVGFLLVYGLLFRESIVMFAANLVVFYVIAVVYMSLYFIQQEKRSVVKHEAV